MQEIKQIRTECEYCGAEHWFTTELELFTFECGECGKFSDYPSDEEDLNE